MSILNYFVGNAVGLAFLSALVAGSMGLGEWVSGQFEAANKEANGGES